jgi:hypothetical protein
MPCDVTGKYLFEVMVYLDAVNTIPFQLEEFINGDASPFVK